MCLKDLYYKWMRWRTWRLAERNKEEQALEPIKDKIAELEVETLEQQTAIEDTKAKTIRKEVKIRETVRQGKGKID